MADCTMGGCAPAVGRSDGLRRKVPSLPVSSGRLPSMLYFGGRCGVQGHGPRGGTADETVGDTYVTYTTAAGTGRGGRRGATAWAAAWGGVRWGHRGDAGGGAVGGWVRPGGGASGGP